MVGTTPPSAVGVGGPATGGATGAAPDGAIAVPEGAGVGKSVSVSLPKTSVGSKLASPPATGAGEIVAKPDGAMDGISDGNSTGASVCGKSDTWIAWMTPRVSGTMMTAELGVMAISPSTEKLIV